MPFSCYRALCGVILFLCAVGTFWDIAADCMKQPVMSSSSKNDSFLPVQHDSTPGLFSDDSNADLLNSATKHEVQSSSSSIPVLVHKNTPGLISTVLVTYTDYNFL